MIKIKMVDPDGDIEFIAYAKNADEAAAIVARRQCPIADPDLVVTMEEVAEEEPS